jgi:ferrochelatase
LNRLFEENENLMAAPYDALIVMSYGGPEGMDDVMPFLENVLRGRNIPRERMLEVAHHYELFGGVSPLNAQNRALIDALRVELAAHGPDLPVYWGNRNWSPYLADTLRQMRDDGVQRALAFVTSAYSSYSGCRQYLEDIERARAEIGEGAPQVDKLRMFYNHPGFIEPGVEHLRQALARVDGGAPVVFTAHSIPLAMAQNSRYVVQLDETCRLIAEGAGLVSWTLVYQSRSGAPHQPWLEPDILDHMRALHAQGVDSLVIMPVGFISDHMEVLYDLDTEAQQLADSLGMTLVRAATVGTHPAFISMIRELIMERMNDVPDRRFLGTHGASHDVCAVDCCLSGVTARRP